MQVEDVRTCEEPGKIPGSSTDSESQRGRQAVPVSDASLAACSEGTNVRRLQALLALLDVELDLLVLVQGLVAGRLNRAEVREHVLAAVVGGDEAKALVGVEPLDGSCCHYWLLLTSFVPRPRLSQTIVRRSPERNTSSAMEPRSNGQTQQQGQA